MPPRPDLAPPAPRPAGGLTGMLDSWTNGLRAVSRSIERD
jgi:hypothetical protein